MASYKVLFDQDVAKDLRKIPRQHARRIVARSLELAERQRPPQSLKIEGTASTHRLRIGDYRVRHRKDIYRVL